MLEPDDRLVIACRTCRDFGMVYDGPGEKKCPECSGWSDEVRADLLKEATRRAAEKPSITMADLTDEEKALFAEWVVMHPRVHKLTLLTWIEGRRYDPSKDEEFLVEARKRFKKWKFLTFGMQGRGA